MHEYHSSHVTYSVHLTAVHVVDLRCSPVSAYTQVHAHSATVGIFSVMNPLCADSPAATTLVSASPVEVTPQVEEQVELYDSEPGQIHFLATI